MGISIKCLPTGKWRENCYVIANGENQALVIDPGEDAAAIIDFLNAEKLSVLAILNTHAHYDHVGAVSEIKKNFGAKFYLHRDDFKLLKQANFYRAIFDGQKIVEIPEVDFDLAEHTAFKFANMDVQVIKTAGHTGGSVCFLIDRNLFVGDTIIARKPGRTDLPGGNAAALAESLNRLLALSDDIMVHPGHGKPVSLGEVKANLTLEMAS